MLITGKNAEADVGAFPAACGRLYSEELHGDLTAHDLLLCS